MSASTKCRLRAWKARHSESRPVRRAVGGDNVVPIDGNPDWERSRVWSEAGRHRMPINSTDSIARGRAARMGSSTLRESVSHPGRRGVSENASHRIGPSKPRAAPAAWERWDDSTLRCLRVARLPSKTSVIVDIPAQRPSAESSYPPYQLCLHHLAGRRHWHVADHDPPLRPVKLREPALREQCL